MPGTFSDIIEHLVPELQRRGRYKREYAKGTLRHKRWPWRVPAATASCGRKKVEHRREPLFRKRRSGMIDAERVAPPATHAAAGRCAMSLSSVIG